MLKSKLVLLFITATIISGRDIILNKNNTVSLTKSIDDETISKLIYDLYNLNDLNNNNIFIYMNTPGGSVEAGNRLIETIEHLSLTKNISCIAHNIGSMGFVILQSCPYRLALKTSTIMQHQISTFIGDEKQRLKNYMKYLDDLENELIYLQAKRMNISKKKFISLTYQNLWLTGNKALETNVVDELITLGCDKSLLVPMIEANTSLITNKIILYTYSKCPLIHQPIDINYNIEL